MSHTPQTARTLTGPVAHQRSVLEAEVAALEARAAALEREKADLAAFAAVAAHELLAPLIMTEAYASMVSDRLDDGRDAASSRDLALLGRHAARVRLLVETLLDDACSSLPRHRRVDLSSVARECLRSLAPEVRASGARVRVAQLPGVIGDPRLISVVLTTLIASALRSGRPGGMLVVDGARHNGDLSICIWAEGATIPSVAPPRHPRSAAVGLHICRHLVERRGGEIGAGPGNRLCLTLPQRY